MPLEKTYVTKWRGRASGLQVQTMEPYWLVNASLRQGGHWHDKLLGLPTVNYVQQLRVDPGQIPYSKSLFAGYDAKNKLYSVSSDSCASLQRAARQSAAFAWKIPFLSVCHLSPGPPGQNGLLPEPNWPADDCRLCMWVIPIRLIVPLLPRISQTKVDCLAGGIWLQHLGIKSRGTRYKYPPSSSTLFNSPHILIQLTRFFPLSNHTMRTFVILSVLLAQALFSNAGMYLFSLISRPETHLRLISGAEEVSSHR